MTNKNSKELIRIYGVTLPEPEYRIKGYGHGSEFFKVKDKAIYVDYVDYFIEDLINLIKEKKLEKVFIKKLENTNNKGVL